ncbi:MAG: hypothetical protein ABW222_13490 [Actinomycetota bacterium]
MATECLKPVGGTRMRVTKVDACGAPITGDGSCVVVSEGFVSIERTAEYADPDQFVVKNAGGRVCLKHRTDPQFLWYLFNITFCEVDPDLYALLTGSTVSLDDALTPNHIGFRTDETLVGTTNYAIEVWTLLAGEECADADDAPYGYYLAPFVGGGTVGTPLTIENGPVSFTVNQARTKGGGQWGVGPYDVMRTDVGGLPAPLADPMLFTEHDNFQLTTLAPPAASCGCSVLTP